MTKYPKESGNHTIIKKALLSFQAIFLGNLCLGRLMGWGPGAIKLGFPAGVAVNKHAITLASMLGTIKRFPHESHPNGTHHSAKSTRLAPTKVTPNQMILIGILNPINRGRISAKQ